MFVLTGGSWTDGYLDEHRDPGTCRVQVSAWLRLRRIDDLYFVPERDWRRVSNYVREIGTARSGGRSDPAWPSGCSNVPACRRCTSA